MEVRQNLNLDANILEFNVDPEFSSAVDRIRTMAVARRRT
jgi:hypothetical protein